MGIHRQGLPWSSDTEVSCTIAHPALVARRRVVDPNKHDIVETGVLTASVSLSAMKRELASSLAYASAFTARTLASTTGHHHGLPNPLRRSDLRGR